MKKTLLLLAAIAAFASCNKEVTSKIDQDKIFTEYELSYNQNTDVTTATATFRFSNELGTRLMLSEPSVVTVDGNAMEWSADNGYYEKSYSGLVATAEFSWTDLDGNVFVNTAEIRDVDFPGTLPTFSLDSSVNYFMWAGLALDSAELVALTVEQEDGAAKRTFSADTVGATTITIDSTKLSAIDAGLVNLVLEKQYSLELMEATSKGGLLIGTYRPTDQSTNLD